MHCVKPQILVFFLSILASACVPKTQYEDQQTKLKETQAALREMEHTNQECNPNTFLELKEQAQSLDILTQELLERNTELSEEVSRLRLYESQVKNQDLGCEKRLVEQREEYEARLSRTRQTYEDLLADIRKQNDQLESELRQLKAPPATKKN